MEIFSKQFVTESLYQIVFLQTSIHQFSCVKLILLMDFYNRLLFTHINFNYHKNALKNTINKEDKL